MKLWWIVNSVRLASERAAVDQLPGENWFRLERWLADEGRLAVDGVIIAHGREYPVRLIFPDQFPSVPAWVQPRQADARWSSHQYGKGGVLCLELRPDNWNPAATGAEVLRSAFHLLEKENPLGDGEKQVVESAHSVGEIQLYEFDFSPVIISSGCLKRTREGNASELKALRAEWADELCPILISDYDDRTAPRQPPTEKIGTWGTVLPVTVVRAEPPEHGKLNRSELFSALKLEPANVADPGVLIVVGAKQTAVYHLFGVDDAFPRRLLVLDDPVGARSGRRGNLALKSAAIVGVGSIGSKIAETLVRAGVGKIVLVDGDVFLPGNLERHTLDWREVGFLKAHGVKRRLLAISPGASVRVISHNLNWQRSAKTHANEISRIAECDLIIDATGDSGSSLFLGSVATENELPFVSALVYEGGLGFLIARAVPRKDADYVNGLAAYNSYCDARGVAAPTSGKKQYEVINDAGDPVVADDAVVSIAAGFASRVVLDILDGSELDPSAWMLIGCRKGWIFERQGHCIALDVGPPKVAAVGHDEQVFEFAKGLVKEIVNATPAT